METIMDWLGLITPVLLMTLLGIPHGALDGYIIKAMSKNIADLIVLFSCYVLVVVLSISSWLLYPTISILGFLAISMIHFGRSDLSAQSCAHPFLAIIARGGLWVIALPLLQWQHTEIIFAHLQTNTAVVKNALGIAIVPWILACGFYLCSQLGRGQRRMCAEWLIGLLTILLLPPLWAICVYFCGWHARRHTAKVVAYSTSRMSAIRDMRVFTGFTLIIAGVLYLLYFRQVAAEPAVITVFFVGLFAITVPHMILIDVYLPRRQEHWRIQP
jgi:Brp/Blh family beta-carotene 15,15'-monooxygenase